LGSQSTGKAFEAQVDQLARLCGWRIHGARAARTKRGWRTPIVGDAGFPDRVYVRGPVVLFRELKAGKARLSPGQKEWGEALLEAGMDWAVWRDADFYELIVPTLNAPK
jgi:hypothetical protein